MTQGELEDLYRAWRQQVGLVPHSYDLSRTTASLNDGCIDLSGTDVAQLEPDPRLFIRGGDFAFQTHASIDTSPAAGGAVLAAHPGSWSLKLLPTASPDVLTVRLDIYGKSNAAGYPGVAGDLVRLNAGLACSGYPCDFNIAFTLLGISDAESSARLYLDGVPADEYRGDKLDGIHFEEVYTNETQVVQLGNNSAASAGMTGTLIDPRFYNTYLSPSEIGGVRDAQLAAECEASSCHP